MLVRSKSLVPKTESRFLLSAAAARIDAIQQLEAWMNSQPHARPAPIQTSRPSLSPSNLTGQFDFGADDVDGRDESPSQAMVNQTYRDVLLSNNRDKTPIANPPSQGDLVR